MYSLKRIKNKYLKFGFFFILALVLGFSVIFLKIPYRAPSSLPKQDIVFQTHIKPLDLWSFGSIGFVNSDGSQEERISIFIPPKWMQGRNPVFPMVSADNQNIIFRTKAVENAPGNLLIMPVGRKGITCNVGSGFYRPGLFQEEDSLLVDVVLEGFKVISVEDCLRQSTVQTLDYSHFDLNTLDAVTIQLSPDEKWIVYETRSDSPYINEIFVRNLDNGSDTLIAAGAFPSWSPDGKQIAFVGDDGIYIVQFDGSAMRKLIAYIHPERGGMRPLESQVRTYYWPPIPSWSPDGKWLTYHRCTIPITPQTGCSSIDDYHIFRLNVETGEETEIIGGGINPYWRTQ